MKYIRNFVYHLLYLIDNIFSVKQPLIIVLCYHNIGIDNWKFSISKSVFETQINYLLENREPLSLGELYSYISGKTLIEKPSFVVTFDDGCKGVLEVADFLKSKSINPTMFLIADSQKANRYELCTSMELLSKKDVLKLINKGWEIGSHSMTHADFGQLTSSMDKEIINSKQKIQSDLGITINYFSYPKGKYDDEIITKLRSEKYKLAVTMDDGFINKNTNLYTIPRIGVDKTHSFRDFRSAISASSICFRSFIKKTFLFKYI